MLKRWRWRRDLVEDRRRVLESLSETDPKDNERLSTSYAEHPLLLVAVVVADVFMDTDIGRLSQAVTKRLAPDRPGREDRERVRTFLRRAESKAGGRELLGAIHFYRPGAGPQYMGGGHQLPMPVGVERVSLLLHQFAPGMVMAGTLVAGPADTAAAIFNAHHPSPVKVVRDGLSMRPVEAAKTRDLELRLRALASLGLLPSGSGLLAGRRYPSGVLVAWSAEKDPPANSNSWRDVGRVLGIEHWRWWEGDGQRIYLGVPVTKPTPRQGAGFSMIVTRTVPAKDRAEFGSSEAVFRYELAHQVYDSMPLLLLHEAASLLGDEAGRLRERLSRKANSRLWGLSLLGLATVVGSLSACQYRLERLRQATSLDGEGQAFDEFPMLVRRPKSKAVAVPELGVVARVARWLRDAGSDPKPPNPPVNLRQVALDDLDRITREGLHDVRLSLDRARLLSDIRSTNALLLFTAVLTALTAILVVRAFH